ncbi:IclR family transcriptional regulator [Amycolatopsis rhabdoformis]|uniref:IclR family transcriptional regulator n=1 Tax=Amycolatopsis rhabdoformis TaxID=1448059 RepID=A0ABZ1ILA5_9PSEU|nr:IclR family transcriptional regulator [Amycolatopsis rhabdoformis]WSE34563.1 IclR family transcriptional regulator [Amycolatopsis rhabdoformis]
MSGNAREPGRSSIDRVLALLDAFDGEDLTLADLARGSGLPLTTTHRLLAALERWGGVERDADGRYRVGVRLWELGTRAAVPAGLRDRALPLMQELYEATRENVQLAIRDGHDVLVVERLTGPRAVPTVTEVGGRLPLHATGVGKVLLAAAPTDVLADVHRHGLARCTPYTVATPGRLATAIATTRDTGFGTVHQEMTLGTASIAAPVSDGRGGLRAALGLVVHSHVDVSRYAAVVRNAADEISRRICAG